MPSPHRPSSRSRVTSFSLHDLTFDVADGGPPDGPAAVLLHGFPGGAGTWDTVSTRLHRGGVRTLAPDQRGYSPRARPRRVADYRIDELVDDVVALADRAGLDRVHLVGHDWGGAVAWALAALHPELIETLTVLSTPHPRAFAASMTRSLQVFRSWYAATWQIPALPEWALLAGDGRLLRTALVRSGLERRIADTYIDRMRQPGALTAALNWYRATGRSLGRFARVGDVAVPTLYVWSSGDPALGRAAAELTASHVTGPYRFEVLDGVSHWIPEMAPGAAAELVLSHIGSGAR